MKDNALYYPYINLPESDWLLKRLLYWDKMYSIATYETIHNKKDLTPLMQELAEDENLFQFIKPLDYYDKLTDFRNSFLETAQDFQFCNPYKKENMTRIHIEKISDLSSQLEQMGVIKPLINYPWYEMDSELSDIFMKDLAVELSEIADINATPITTNTFQCDKKFIENEVLNFTMPLPQGKIELKKIREFRERNKKTIKIYRKKIDDITDKILKGNSSEERQDLLNDARKNFTEELEILHSEISRLWIKQSKNIIVPLVSSVTAGLFSGGLSGAAAGLITAMAPNIYDSLEKKEKNVLTYATDLQRI